ncbi:ABC transporter substrate-binding protein [Alteripontixanthobacter maritimus]|nr:ABC transporter substrate-binding protein [Alteripontixanthobacter maritimus]
MEAPPEARPTIVSLNPCADAILAEVSEPGQLLAISHYSHDPRSTSMDLKAARAIPATGGTVEEVLALDPDLVVASTFLPPATRASFAELGIEVELLGIASSVETSIAQIRQLARIAGQPARGERLVARIDRALARAQPSAKAKPVSAVLWQPGGIVPGESALVTQIMQRTGFLSHSAQRGMEQAEFLALENLLADPPDLLLTAGAERAQQHEALAAVPGMRTAEFAPSLLYCGGPTIIRAAQRLAIIREQGA